MKESPWLGDYLLNSNGEYKYLFNKGEWYVIGGPRKEGHVTPFRCPILVTEAIAIGFW